MNFCTANSYNLNPNNKPIGFGSNARLTTRELLFDTAELGINPHGKSFADIKTELKKARERMAAVINQAPETGIFADPEKVKRLRKVIESEAKTKEDAILVLNALGVFLKIDKAKNISASSTEHDIRKAFRAIALNVHPEAVNGNGHYMKLLSQVKNLLLPAKHD